MKRVVLAIVLVCALVGAVAGCGVLVMGDLFASPEPRSFDAADWQRSLVPGPASDGRCDDGLRTSMVRDLVTNHLRAGQTPPSVERLLGKAASVFEPARARDDTRLVVYSWMTSEDAIGMDCLVLHVDFENGRLVDAYEVNP